MSDRGDNEVLVQSIAMTAGAHIGTDNYRQVTAYLDPHGSATLRVILVDDSDERQLDAIAAIETVQDVFFDEVAISFEFATEEDLLEPSEESALVAARA